MKFSCQNRCRLYPKAASTKFGDIGFNFIALQGYVKSLPKHLLSPSPRMESHEQDEINLYLSLNDVISHTQN